MVAYFHIQHTNGGNFSLAFLKCLQFTITLLLITNRYIDLAIHRTTRGFTGVISMGARGD